MVLHSQHEYDSLLTVTVATATTATTTSTSSMQPPPAPTPPPRPDQYHHYYCNVLSPGNVSQSPQCLSRKPSSVSMSGCATETRKLTLRACRARALFAPDPLEILNGCRPNTSPKDPDTDRGDTCTITKQRNNSSDRHPAFCSVYAFV